MKAIEYLRPENWQQQEAGPRYLRLRRHIEEGIASGVLTPDSPLPSEREIAAVTELSRVTVRKAIEQLVDKGVVVQRQGSGSFVGSAVPRVEQSLAHLTSFTEDMARRGMEVTSTWLDRGLYPPSPEEVFALALPSGEPVARIARLRQAGVNPMAIERASLPRDLLPNPEQVTTSLYQYLGRLGHRPVRALQKISAINLNAEDASLLGVAVDAAGLRIERTSYLPSGRVVEFTRSIYRGDAYDFVAELRLSSGR